MGDRVFVKVTPFKHMISFEKKGKLAPQYISLYKLMEIVNKVAYKLTLLVSMKRIHMVFHISSLHKYISDLSYVLKTKEV